MLLKEGDFTIEDIPVSKVKVFIHRERERAGKAELVDSIRKHGLIIPVTVVLKDSGDYELIKGEGRLLAHRELGMDAIRAFVIPEDRVDPNEKTVEWLVENSVRERLPPMLKARLSDLDRQRGMTFEEIGKRYDMSPSTARQYADAFRKSSDKVVELVESDKMRFTHAKVIAEGIDDKRTQDSVAAVVTDDKLGLDDTKAVVRIAKREAERSAEPLSIPQLKDAIAKVKRDRVHVRDTLLNKNRRYEVLSSLTNALMLEPEFQSAIGRAGISVWSEEK